MTEAARGKPITPGARIIVSPIVYVDVLTLEHYLFSESGSMVNGITAGKETISRPERTQARTLFSVG